MLILFVAALVAVVAAIQPAILTTAARMSLIRAQPRAKFDPRAVEKTHRGATGGISHRAAAAAIHRSPECSF